MEKIKSVLHGHKKSEDATHDVQASSTGAHSTGTHQDATTHPIYDEMTGKESTYPTTGTTTSAGQTGTTKDLVQGENRGTEGPFGTHGPSTGQTNATGLGHTDHITPAGPSTTGSHGASTDDSIRPGAGGGHDGISTASIKSGVIGFGSTGKAQEHAALSPHQKLESQLDRNQVVGGGIPATGGNTATGPTVTSTSDKDGLPLPVTSAQPHSNTSNIAPLGTTRQESYTKDTDRSFPLAGGVASKHGTSAAHPTGQQGLTTQNPVQQTSSTHHTAPLVGGVASKHEPSATHPTEQHDLTSSAHPATSEREPGTKEKGVGVQEGHGREGLAGAAAAATALGVASHSHHKDSQPQAHATQPVGASMQDPKNSSTNHPATGHHPDALAAATAAAAKFSNTHGTGVGAQDSSLTGTTQPHATGVLPGERPTGTRSASHRHIPGEFPSPTPDESKTFLYYRDDVVPEPGATTAGTANSTAGPHSSDALNKADPRVDSDLDGSKTTGTAPLISGAGQHELRHTGSLDQPQSRSEDHHHGRDAAVAGGVAAGAAGLAYGAHQKRDASDAHGSMLPHEPSPYSSKQLDPRVSGGKVPLEQQRFDPQAKAEPHQTSSSVGVVSSTSGTHGLTRDEPTTTPHSATTKQADSQSHHGRDAALLAGGAGTAAGIHHATKDDRHGDAVGSNTMAGPHTTTGSQIASGTHTTNASNHPETTKHEESKIHHGRDAALLSGGAATAAGVHHATKKDHASDAVESDKVTTGPQHKSSLLNKLDPRVKSDKSKTSTDTAEASSVPVAAKHDEPKHHHSRDAALVAGGAATAVGAHKASQRDNLSRNDTPGTGTYVLSQQGSNTSVPFDGATSADPHSASHTSAPLAANTTTGSDHSSRLIDPSTGKNAGGHKTYSGPLTTDGTPFYGAVGAPAPIADNKHGKPEVISSTEDQGREHHYGRDAALVGAGATTANGLAHGAGHDKKSDAVPTQSDSTHHSVGSTTAPTAAGTHQSDPAHKNHHLGRDAAIAGGTGAAGYGVYEAAKTYGDHRSTQPGASMNEQRYDTTASGTNTTNPVPASGHYDYNDQNTSRNAGLGSGAALGAGMLGGAAYADSKHHGGQHVPAASSQPLSSSTHQGLVTGTRPTDTMGQTSHDPNATTEHSDHTGRNVALGGAALGAGALGGAAYAGHKHDNAQNAPGPLNESLTSPQQGTIASQNTQSSVPGASHNRYDSIVGPNQKDDHNKRDAALMGTAGAATAGGVAYGYSQHHDNDEEKRLQKEQHKLDKEHAKQEKDHAKQEKAAHKHEKEAEKESSEPEKKHGILGFLHRDKTKKEKTSADTSPRHSSEVRRSSDGLRHSSDDPDSPRWKAKSKLHKDPPKGHPAREALDHHEMGEMGGKREHVGIDGPIGDQERISGFHNTAGAKPLSEVLGVGSASEGYRGVDQGGMGTGHTGDLKRDAPY